MTPSLIFGVAHTRGIRLSEERSFSSSMRRQEGFRFKAGLGLEGVGPLYMDERARGS
jgi:hypothetical protein